MKRKERLNKVHKNRKYLDEDIYKNITERWLKAIEEERNNDRKEIVNTLNSLNNFGLTNEMIENIISTNTFTKLKSQYFSKYISFKTSFVVLVVLFLTR